MLARAAAAFIVLPGTAGFALPIWIGLSSGSAERHGITAAVLLSSGTLLLLGCAREFYVSGRGTLAPWAPPRHLVTTGPYRVSRNPMYLGVLTVLAAWCTLWSSRALVVYAVLAALAFHLRVLLFEEPWAARRFGAEWHTYRARVPRWIGRAHRSG